MYYVFNMRHEMDKEKDLVNKIEDVAEINVAYAAYPGAHHDIYINSKYPKTLTSKPSDPGNKVIIKEELYESSIPLVRNSDEKSTKFLRKLISEWKKRRLLPSDTD